MIYLKSDAVNAKDGADSGSPSGKAGSGSSRLRSSHMLKPKVKKEKSIAEWVWKGAKKRLRALTDRQSPKERHDEYHSRSKAAADGAGTHSGTGTGTGTGTAGSFPIFVLPEVLLVDIFGLYLDAPSLVQLDTAVCSKEQRPYLRTLLYGSRGVCGKAFERHVYRGPRALEWALRKGVTFDYMHLCMLAPGDEEEGGGDDDEEEEGFSTTLHWACQQRDCARLVRLLLQRGSAEREAVAVAPAEAEAEAGEEFTCGQSWSVESVDSEGRTPLMVACEYGNTRNIEVLLRDSYPRPNVNTTDELFRTPLYYLCDSDSVGVGAGASGANREQECSGTSSIQLLMKAEYQIDPNIQNAVNGHTALHRACENSLLQAAQLIVRGSGGSIPVIPDLQSNIGNSALHNAAGKRTAKGKSCQTIIRLLLYEAKADVNIQNDEGQTPLHVACLAGNLDIARILLLEGAANSNIKDNSGRSVLLYACEDNNVEFVKLLLLQSGRGLDTESCDLNIADINGFSALHVAMSHSSLLVAEVLISSSGQCSVDSSGPDGSTALYRCVEFGNEDAVRYLVKHGHADVTICNNDGMSPLQCAQENELDSIASLLETVIAGKFSASGQAEEASDSLQLQREEHCDVDSSALRNLSFGAAGGVQYLLQTSGKYLDVFTRKQLQLPAPSVLSEMSKSANVTADVVSVEERVPPPLFVDDLWPGAYVLADYLQQPAVLREHILDKRVVELGAGAALPGLVSACIGAKFVCISDYPAPGVLDNIRAVLTKNSVADTVACAIGHIWGESVEPLLQLRGSLEQPLGGYDTALMAECLWKDTKHLHEPLLRSVYASLRCGGHGFFSFAHRPSSDGKHVPAHDLQIFEMAKEVVGFAEVVQLQSVTKYPDCMDASGEAVEVKMYMLVK